MNSPAPGKQNQYVEGVLTVRRRSWTKPLKWAEWVNVYRIKLFKVFYLISFSKKPDCASVDLSIFMSCIFFNTFLINFSTREELLHLCLISWIKSLSNRIARDSCSPPSLNIRIKPLCCNSSWKREYYDINRWGPKRKTYNFFIDFCSVCYTTINHMFHDNYWYSFAKLLFGEK